MSVAERSTGWQKQKGASPGHSLPLGHHSITNITTAQRGGGAGAHAPPKVCARAGGAGFLAGPSTGPPAWRSRPTLRSQHRSNRHAQAARGPRSDTGVRRQRRVVSLVHAARGVSCSTLVASQCSVCSSTHAARGPRSRTCVPSQSRCCSPMHAARELKSSTWVSWHSRVRSRVHAARGARSEMRVELQLYEECRARFQGAQASHRGAVAPKCPQPRACR